jgi:hypothetical protein
MMGRGGAGFTGALRLPQAGDHSTYVPEPPAPHGTHGCCAWS